MFSTKKYRLTVSEEELKILEDAMGDWKITARHTVSEFAHPPTNAEKRELLDKGERLHNRIRKLLTPKR